MLRSPGQLRAAAPTLAVVAASLLVSCNNREPPDPPDNMSSTSLTVPAELAPVTVGLPAPQVDAPISLGAGTVICNADDGVVYIKDVMATDPTQNLTIDEFAVRPNPSLSGETNLGGEPGELKQLGFTELSKAVNVACDPDSLGTGFELGIQVVRTGPGPARARGLEVAWASGGTSGVLHIPLSIVLCDNPTASIDRCAPE
jgi:hypothetical protein